MKSRLDEIEARLQAWIENGLAWLPWRSRQPRNAAQLIGELRALVAREAESDQPAANILHIFMNPGNTSAWLESPEWQDWLLDAWKEMAREAGVTFFAPAELSLKADPDLDAREVRLIAAFPAQEVNSTAVMPAFSGNEERKSEPQTSAFLIINGKDIFPLNRAVTNIGRRRDNHIILDDLRVSRNHAQIRSLRGSYTLFDLNSTGGTFVNGKRVTQHTLLAGDVISFAGVKAIYGEELASTDDGHGTSPAQLRSGEGQSE